MSLDNLRFMLAAVLVSFVGLTGVAAAKSLYVIADWNGTYSAYNINPNGTVTWQANYASSHMPPVGMAVHDASATLFVTFEGRGYVDIVDAVTMSSIGPWVLAPGANNLAGIDVDDINNIVYTVDRRTQNVYAYDWDASIQTLTLIAGFPKTLANCEGAYGLAVDEIAQVMWVACGAGTVWGYDLTQPTLPQVQSFPVAIPPIGIAVDRIRGVVYTTAPDSGCGGTPTGLMLSRYDLDTGFETTVNMGHGGMGLAVDERTGYVYVTAGCTRDTLSVWDTTTAPFTKVDETPSIGRSPAGLAIGNVSFNPLNLTKDNGLEQDGCAVPGGTIAYEICYDNLANPFDVTGATLIDNLPAEVAWVASTGSYDSATHIVTWNLGTLPAGSGQACVDLDVALDVSAEPESDFTNLVTIESADTAPTTVENITDVCPVIPVAFDIKPMSCRNPLSGGGVLPAAILGTADFDVTQIDPASLRLEGISILRWALGDVETPYEPYLGKEYAFDCHALGPDSYLDLTFKFKKRDVIAALGDVEDGDVLVLQVTGNLKPEFGGTPFLGEDVVVILD